MVMLIDIMIIESGADMMQCWGVCVRQQEKMRHGRAVEAECATMK